MEGECFLRVDPYDEIKKLSEEFHESDWPIISCRFCGFGQVLPAPTTEFHFELKEPYEYRSNPNWEPEWLSGIFAVKMGCSNSKCSEKFLAAGFWRYVQADRNSSNGPDFDRLLKLDYALPSFPITDKLPVSAPTRIVERIHEASAVMWHDPNSASNILRVLIEELLDDQTISRTSSRRNGRQGSLSLDKRIELFAHQHASSSNFLMAAKWTGNVGSHSRQLEVKHALQQARMISEALWLIYDDQNVALLDEATAIINHRGPV